MKRTMLALALAMLFPAAVRAELHAGIEIGGMGVKATVIDVAGDGDDIDITVKLTDSANTALTAGVAMTGKFDPAAVAATAKAVKKHHDRMTREFMVGPANIHVVGSSGLFAAIADKPDRIAENKTALAKAVKDAAGVELNFITVKQESELSIAGTLPRGRRANGVLVDIGSGNTKGGIQIEKDKYATFGIPFGTVTFAEFAKKNNVACAKQLATLFDQEVAPKLRKGLGELPGIAKRDKIYLSGGAVWGVTTLIHPADTKAYTLLTLKEVEAFEAKLIAAGSKLPEPDLSTIANEKQREKAAKEIASVNKVYPPERLLAGVQILKGIFRELGGEEQTKQFYFARHGQLGWLLAYVTATATKP